LNACWDYFWPVFALGAAVGVVGGWFGFRRNSRLIIGAGALAALAAAALWHGPLGGADRFKATVEANVARTLAFYEMTQVKAGLHRDPLTRRVMMSGTANDFQRNELVRLMDDIPGVSGASWGRTGGLPLIAEAMIGSLIGFLLGLLLAYGIERRRRYNAEWTW
jgi:hypothetical protein